jgi:leucyl aminopeptidase
MSPSVSPVPSLDVVTDVAVAAMPPAEVEALGVLVGARGDLRASIGIDRDRLSALGFIGAVGDALALPTGDGPVVVLIGIGDGGPGTDLRAVGAAFARACGWMTRVALMLDGLADAGDSAAVAEALVEGVLLARYHYPALKSEDPGAPISALTLVVSGDPSTTELGAARGKVLAAATALARDLANTPHNHLSASRLGELALELGPGAGLGVEVFDEDDLVEMRMAGLLAISAGSAEPPRLIRLTYRPEDPTGSVAFIGKGIMYDSGGLSLKPSDAVHAQMKNDMSGAAAVLASMLALRDLGCTTAVTGYLTCTDNMPSGTATALGDVITYRDGTTVEMLDTDAEGRVVMADALILAREEGVDAIVDIATLTGSAIRALGKDMSAMFANDDAMARQTEAAAEVSGEMVWRMPLHRPYLREIDSLTADMMNCAPIGKPDAIIASLFLEHFVGDVPWAHIDMCGPAQADTVTGLQVPGCSGWGARILAHIALGFESPS